MTGRKLVSATDCLRELSRSYGMLAVILERKGSNLDQDSKDATDQWTVVHAAHARLNELAELHRQLTTQAKATGG